MHQPLPYLCDYHGYSIIVSLYEPFSYKKVSVNPLWQQAMREELKALTNTHTWHFVDILFGKSILQSKWVYKIKTHVYGLVECYKIQLLIKGFI